MTRDRDPSLHVHVLASAPALDLDEGALAVLPDETLLDQVVDGGLSALEVVRLLLGGLQLLLHLLDARPLGLEGLSPDLVLVLLVLDLLLGPSTLAAYLHEHATGAAGL